MRILHQYLAILFFAFLVPSVIVAVITWGHMRRIGEEVADRSAAALEAQAPARLEALVREEAAQIDHRLALLENDLSDLRNRYDALHRLPAAPLPAAPLPAPPASGAPGADRAGLPGFGYVHREVGAWADFQRLGVSSPWIPRPIVVRLRQDPQLRATVERRLSEVTAMHTLMAEVGYRHDALVDLVWIVLEPGVSDAWPAYDYERLVVDRPEITDLDELKEDYVRLVNPLNNPARVVRWLDPYFDRFRGVWMTSCVAPLYEGEQFLGSVGMDILLPVLAQRTLEIHPSAQGYAFLMALGGRPIAMPDSALPELVPDPAEAEALYRSFHGDPRSATEADQRALMLRARIGSGQPGPLTDLVAEMDAPGAAGTRRLTLGDQEHLVSFATVDSTGWTMGVVVTEEEVLQPTLPLRAAIQAGNADVLRQFAIFGCVLSLSTVLAGLLLHRSTIRPLERLKGTVEAVSWNRLEMPVWDRRRSDEIGMLYAQYAEMIERLRRARAEGEAGRLALQDEKELLAVTLRSIGDAVVTTDPQGRVVMMNPVAEHLTRCPEAEAAGRPFESVVRLVDGAGAAVVQSPAAWVLAHGTPFESVERADILAGGDERRRLSVSAAPIRDSEQSVIGVVVVFRDITVRSRIEEEMSRIQKIESVGVLAAGIAHDFNNLLAAIGGNLSILEERLGAGAGLQRFVEAGQRGVSLARDLTVQLLTFAKGGAPIRGVVDLGPVLREAVAFSVRGTGVEWTVDVAPGLRAVAVDPGQIGRVVQNLCLNAVQATQGRGRLSVHARMVQLEEGARPPLGAGSYVEVTLQDDGPGIPPEQLQRIFEPYFTTRADGSGLGLAVTFSILRRHEGYIEANSAVGQGATFRFWLPATDLLPAAPSLPPPPIARGGGRLLLLEDDAPVREMLEEVLGSLGYTVTAVAEGSLAVLAFREALEQSRPFHAVMLDLTVPGGLGGREVIGSLQALDPGVRAIVTSGYSNDPILAHPERYGFLAALLKPCTVRTVASTVARVMAMEVRPRA
jgi:PAS domain S-box-containing protein